MRATIAATVGAAFPLLASALNPIEVRGQDFVDSVTNNRFMILGVDYQPGGQGAYGDANSQDPLSNSTACLRDASLMQQLGINTIRSYNVDPTLNHDECASIFNAAGIYMILDVNSPLAGQSIDRSNPFWTYSTSYLQHIFSVVEAFKSYPNTLGFFSGNEVINDLDTAKNGNPSVMRAVVRDLKNYISHNSKRQIPVGYSAADVREILEDTHAFMQCSLDGDDNNMSRSDFFGLNSYSWCGSSSFKIAGYDTLVDMFSNTTIPVFFSEFGCNTPSPRQFDEIQALYGEQMTVMSGGLVYEWSQEPANYGLVDIYSNGSLQLRPDFDTLQSQYNKLNVTLLESSNSTATGLKPPKCAASLISENGFPSDFKIPSPPAGAEAIISSGISNAPTGSIVPVKETSVSVPVYGSDGVEIKDLTVSTTDGSNKPSGDDTDKASGSIGARSTSSGTPKTSSASATATQSGSSAASTASATGSATNSASPTPSTGAANVLAGFGSKGALGLVMGAGLFALRGA